MAESLSPSRLSGPEQPGVAGRRGSTPGGEVGIAFVRAPSPALAACLLTFRDRTAIDVERAAEQHAAYCQALATAGLDVRAIPSLADAADAVFVEDTAILADDLAVMTNPGNPARRTELASVAAALAPQFQVVSLDRGTLDGGDVLRIGKTLLVGLSTRTDAHGASRLAELVADRGFTVRAVDVGRCLHLKTGVTRVDAGPEPFLLLNPASIDPTPFRAFPIQFVDPSEPFGANSLSVGSKLFLSAQAPHTAEALARRGLSVDTLDISELEKAEAGLTCMSLIHRHAAPS